MPIPQQYRSLIRLRPIDLHYQSASWSTVFTTQESSCVAIRPPPHLHPPPPFLCFVFVASPLSNKGRASVRDEFFFLLLFPIFFSSSVFRSLFRSLIPLSWDRSSGPGQSIARQSAKIQSGNLSDSFSSHVGASALPICEEKEQKRSDSTAVTKVKTRKWRKKAKFTSLFWPVPRPNQSVREFHSLPSASRR